MEINSSRCLLLIFSGHKKRPTSRTVSTFIGFPKLPRVLSPAYHKYLLRAFGKNNKLKPFQEIHSIQESFFFPLSRICSCRSQILSNYTTHLMMFWKEICILSNVMKIENQFSLKWTNNLYCIAICNKCIYSSSKWNWNLFECHQDNVHSIFVKHSFA